MREYKIKVLQLVDMNNFHVFLKGILEGDTDCVVVIENPVLVSDKRDLARRGHKWRNGVITIRDNAPCRQEFQDRVLANAEYFKIEHIRI